VGQLFPSTRCANPFGAFFQPSEVAESAPTLGTKNIACNSAPATPRDAALFGCGVRMPAKRKVAASAQFLSTQKGASKKKKSEPPQRRHISFADEDSW